MTEAARASYRAAQEELIAQLRELTADRPAHAAYLEALLAVELDDAMEVDVPRGVSGRVAEALLDDVLDARTPPPLSGFAASWNRAYRKRRQTDARAAVERERTRNSLESALRL